MIEHEQRSAGDGQTRDGRRGLTVKRHFTKAGEDPFATVEWAKRTSRITNPDGSVVFEMNDAEIPAGWSQVADRHHGLASTSARPACRRSTPTASPLLDEDGNPVLGPERSARQVIHRLAGCWRWWGETHGYFATAEDAQAFDDELAYMLVHQMAAPNSPQWFNTGLAYAYGITGPAQGHYYVDPADGEIEAESTTPTPARSRTPASSSRSTTTSSARAASWTSGSARRASSSTAPAPAPTSPTLRGEGEKLSGGGTSSGLMSFLKVGDRAAGAIKSGGTTRRAAKMVCLDIDHPDIEDFINWKAARRRRSPP